MDAMTTLWPTLTKIKLDFPDITFKKGDVFSWFPKTQTVFYKNLRQKNDFAQLLHEIAHAKLQHESYQRDITLIDMERSAWEYAVDMLAPAYNLPLQMDDDIVQDSLDSYRNWLHSRSICPNCEAVGMEIAKHRYRCLQCHSEWRVNEARSCELRRYRK